MIGSKGVYEKHRVALIREVIGDALPDGAGSFYCEDEVFRAIAAEGIGKFLPELFGISPVAYGNGKLSPYLYTLFYR